MAHLLRVGLLIVTVVAASATPMRPTFKSGAVQYPSEQTSAKVGDPDIRHLLVSVNRPDEIPVSLSGPSGSIEQVTNFQRMAYRAGYGFGEGFLANSAESIRSLVVRLLIVAGALLATALLTEFALEARDVARYMPGQTFATVGNARIRYRLTGAERLGSTVVLLSGLNGSIEQFDNLQRAISGTARSLAYDRAGYGFSERSAAHSAEDQARELAALLDVLKLEGPIVLVAYSASAPIARIFASLLPEKTASLYLIDPIWGTPELYERLPQLHTLRRRNVRFVAYHLLASSLGYIRFTQRMRNWRGPASLVEQRAEAVLSRRPHYWALAQEWYALRASFQQTLVAPISRSIPIEVAFPKTLSEDETSKVAVKLYAELAARSSRGKLLELEGIDHSDLLQPGPVLDRLAMRIKRFAQADAG